MAYAGKAFDHLGIILHTGQSAAGPSVAGCRVLGTWCLRGGSAPPRWICAASSAAAAPVRTGHGNRP